jgi:hypothetical protein
MQWKCYVLVVYENGTMRPVETVLRKRGVGDKGKRWRGESN